MTSEDVKSSDTVEGVSMGALGGSGNKDGGVSLSCMHVCLAVSDSL